MKRHDPLDPQVELELEALERALNGDRSDPTLATLIDDVRAQAPPIDEGFRATLGERVSAGFPRRQIARTGWLRSRLLLPASGLAVAAVVGAIVLAVSPNEATQDDVQTTPTANGIATMERAATSPQAADSAAAKVAPEVGSISRKVEHSTQLALSTSPGDLRDVADNVVRETQRAGGYVRDSSVATGDGSNTATFTLRIPAKRLDTTIAALSKLAHVSSLSQDSNDITASYVSAANVAADAERRRQALLQALAKATEPGRIDSLKQRIAVNRRELASAKAAVRELDRRADLATVSVDVDGTATDTGSAGWSIGDATDDAIGVLGAIGGALIVTLAVGIPLAIALGLAFLAWRAALRRNRDSVLS